MPDPVDVAKMTPEEVAARMSAAEGDFNSGNDGGGGNSTHPTFTPSPVWDYYKTKLPEEERTAFKLPETISAENEQQLLDEYLTKVYSKEPTINTLHPLAREVQEYASKVENFDPIEFMKSKVGGMSHQGKTDDDIVYEVYAQKLLKSDQNPYGKTEEEIKELLKSVNPLEKTAIAIERRKQIDAETQSRYNNPEAAKKAREEQIKFYVDSTTKYIDEKFKPEQQRGDKAIETRSIAGIDIGESNFQAFKSEFMKMALPNEKGVIELAVNLQDNDAILEFAMYRRFKDEIAKAVVKAKNEGKFIALEQLPKVPPVQKGGNANAQQEYSLEEQIERMSKPEGSY